MMVVLLVEEANAGTDGDTSRIPDYEPDYENVAINVADYQFAV
jgi:hypothetical protein